MNDISKIKRIEEEVEQKIIELTTSKFAKHIELATIQNECLREFLASFPAYGNVKPENDNQFIICFSLLNDMLRKEKLCIDLIKKGFYDESAEMIRHIMQSCFHIIYLSKNTDSWKDWIKENEFQEYQVNKNLGIPSQLLSKEIYEANLEPILPEFKINYASILSEDFSKHLWVQHRDLGWYFLIPILKRPNTVFGMFFEQFLAKTNNKEYYPMYRKLCAWSHPSLETMRSCFELQHNQNNKYHFTSRYQEDKADLLLNLMFGFINIAIWDGFKDVFTIDGKVPEALNKYKEIQKDVQPCFDKFFQ